MKRVIFNLTGKSEFIEQIPLFRNKVCLNSHELGLFRIQGERQGQYVFTVKYKAMALSGICI